VDRARDRVAGCERQGAFPRHRRSAHRGMTPSTIGSDLLLATRSRKPNPTPGPTLFTVDDAARRRSRLPPGQPHRR
jgi:hypothetical protein